MHECSAFVALNNERKKSKGSGGGGNPKIDLPGNQSKSNDVTGNRSTKHDTMHGISKRMVSTTAGRINVIAKVSFKQRSSLSKKSLSTTINYNLDRERGLDEPERSLFTKNLSDIDRHLAKEEIERDFGERVAYHKIILSSGDNHVSQRDFTRTVMAEWQRSIEKEFEYYAVEHRNTDYHHVHIIIPGQSPDHNRDLSFNREEITTLREIGADYLARDRSLDRQLDREVALEFGRDRLDREVEKLFHISKPYYEREQSSIGLKTYKEMREDQKELGLLFKYDPDNGSKNADQRENDHILAQKISEEQNNQASLDERESDWDKDLGDQIFSQGETDRDLQNREIEQDDSRKPRRQNDDDCE